jgi:hypothetical protein
MGADGGQSKGIPEMNIDPGKHTTLLVKVATFLFGVLMASVFLRLIS